MSSSTTTTTARGKRTNLNSLLDKRAKRVQQIEAYQGPNLTSDERTDFEGDIWDQLKENKQLESISNLEVPTLEEIHLNMLPFIASTHRTGPRAQSPPIDQMICYIGWLKMGAKLDITAKVLGMKTNRFKENIDRIRPIVNAALKASWWDTRIHPVPLSNTTFPHVGLIIDGHTTQTFRPKAPFEEAKIYYDGKNKIYGVKNEVGVTAAAPHYCLFITPHVVG